jgi:hypothetical protein
LVREGYKYCANSEDGRSHPSLGTGHIKSQKQIKIEIYFIIPYKSLKALRNVVFFNSNDSMIFNKKSETEVRSHPSLGTGQEAKADTIAKYQL